MSAEYLIIASTWILIAALLAVQPWLTRKNVIFGVVFGSADIWNDKTVGRIRARYAKTVVAGSAAVSVLEALSQYITSPSDGMNTAVYLFGIGILLTLSTVAFIIAHARTRDFKLGMNPDTHLVSEKLTIETSMSDRQTVLSLPWLFGFLPLLLADYGVAVFGYRFMPSKIPIHYNFTAANGWAPKSWADVMAPVMICTMTVFLLLICCLFTRRAPASVRGNPAAAPGSFIYRKYMIALFIIIGLFIEGSTLLIEIGFLSPISPVWFNLINLFSVLMMAVILLIYFRFVRAKRPKGKILDDDARWILGMFYYNPSDPSVFVEKRSGIGYTLNFARPAGWVLIAGIIAFVIFSAFAAGR